MEKNSHIEKKVRGIVEFLESQLLPTYGAINTRYLIEDKKNGSSVLQLLEAGKTNEALEKIDTIYSARNIDESKLSKQVLFDTITTAIELHNEISDSNIDKPEPIVDNDDLMAFPVSDENNELEENSVFDEEKYERIFDSVYNNLKNPENHEKTIENDFISFARAAKALDIESGNDDDINISNLLDAYSEVANNHKNPDIIPTLVWFLPTVKKQVSEKLDNLKSSITKIRSGEDSSKTLDEVMSEINYYESVNNSVTDLENNISSNEEDEDLSPLPESVSLPIEDAENNPNPETLVEKEKTPHDYLEKYFFEKGISQVIVHGADFKGNESHKKHGLVPKMDFDVDSAIMVLDELGVKYQKGAKYTWIHPEAKLVEDKNGKYYFEYKGEKTNLTPGTVVLDVGKSNGFEMLPGDIFMFDHHGNNVDGPTSATKLLVENAQQLNCYKDGTKEFPEFLNHYSELVTQIDNLSMDRDMDMDDFQKNYANTMTALEPLVYSKNRKMMMDIFRKYPNISINGFNDKEKKYEIGFREYTSTDDHRDGFKDIKIYSEIPENHNLDYVYEKFTIADLVENQQRALDISIKEIDYHAQKMFSRGLTPDSPILGRTILIDQEKFTYKDNKGNLREFTDYTSNSFGALTAYNMHYDTMIILNRPKGNQIFVSSKNPDGLKAFANNFNIYYDNSVVVRDSMFIFRDDFVKDKDPEDVLNAIMDSAKIDGFSKDAYLKEVDKFINKSKKHK